MRWVALACALVPSSAFGLEDGTLLFVENGQPLVECYTHSDYSHVAIVLDGHVYEAEPPKIRKMTTDEWFTNVGMTNEGKKNPALVSIIAPDEPYKKEELAKMREFLEAQVGRRYSIRGYLRKIPGDGIHCSEMCSGALEASGRHDFETPNCQLSPADLLDVAESHHQQGDKLYIYIKKEHRRSTMTRWKDWWAGKGRTCRWSCWETWTFCW